MTNTLHRYGNSDSFRDDYIIFAIPCKGKNDEGSIEKLQSFLRICARHNPINMGNGNRSSLSPQKLVKPTVHWNRRQENDWEEVIQGIVKPGTAAAVFATEEDASKCFKEVIEADFGLSVNMSTSVDNAKRLAEKNHISRHSVEYSLETNDPHDHLPNSQVLALSTMCGHGMVSFNLARKMLDMVREGRRTADEAAATLVRFCPCGIYNPVRAKRLIDEACKEQR